YLCHRVLVSCPTRRSSDLQWALLMWAINLLFFGPIAVLAAGMGGATHRLDIENIPWLTALLWAPIAEELVFRYGLRRLKYVLLLDRKSTRLNSSHVKTSYA